MDSLFPHNMTLKQVVEALVFASPKPLTTKEILAALKSAGNPDKTDDENALAFAKSKEVDVEAALADIAKELKETGRAFQLSEQINGWSFVTDPSAVHWVRQLYPEAKPTRLTGPQLETLAIIAYRQPVTRADCEAVRGVAVDSVVQVLMERSLIKIAGRADVPGRPLLYETTQYFLQHFGIKTVDELPNAQELKRVELPKAPVPEEPAKEAKEAKESAKKAEEPAPAEAAPAAEAEAAPAPVEDATAPTEEVASAEEPAAVDEPAAAEEPAPVEEAGPAEAAEEQAEPAVEEEAAPAAEEPKSPEA